MSRPLSFAAIGLAFALTGCLHPKIGPHSIPLDRADYSMSLSDSWKEQTLLNIVKVRYVDPPVFVDVGSIVSSYTLSQGASAGGSFEPSGTNGASVGGAVNFSASPTVTYTPLTGNAYIRGLVTPLPAIIVFAAIQNGAPADAILLSSVSSINGLRNQRVSIAGIKPADPDFHRVRELLRDIQASGGVQVDVKEDPKKQVTNIITLRSNNLPAEVLAEIAELRRLLHLDPDATELRLVSAPLPSNDREIAVQTRSISELLANMAAQVEVPVEDAERHRAFPGFEAGRDVPCVVPIMRIKSSKTRPSESFVSVHYRSTWFWVDDDDLVSKRAFAELMQLFTMTDTGERDAPPLLTIPTR
jgi:hypothetical protein